MAVLSHDEILNAVKSEYAIAFKRLPETLSSPRLTKQTLVRRGKLFSLFPFSSFLLSSSSFFNRIFSLSLGSLRWFYFKTFFRCTASTWLSAMSSEVSRRGLTPLSWLRRWTTKTWQTRWRSKKARPSRSSPDRRCSPPRSRTSKSPTSTALCLVSNAFSVHIDWLEHQFNILLPQPCRGSLALCQTRHLCSHHCLVHEPRNQQSPSPWNLQLF